MVVSGDDDEVNRDRLYALRDRIQVDGYQQSSGILDLTVHSSWFMVPRVKQ